MHDAPAPAATKSWFWPLALAIAALAIVSLVALRTTGWLASTPTGGSYVVLEADADLLRRAGPRAMDVTIDLLRGRIDAMGLHEPTFEREGPSRIVVRIPGLDDPESIKPLFGRGQLEFKLVDMNALASDIDQGIAPIGGEILPYAKGSGYEGVSIAVRRVGGIRGNSLESARQGYNSTTDEPVVDITFDPRGAARFCELTEANVGTPFAMILDDEVLSAPNIAEPICGGQAQISGGFTTKSAEELAILLQTGALPVGLTVVGQGALGTEPQGPDAGKD